jgi:hypothetical protein
MPRNVKITKTNAGGSQGPFTIYHTSVSPANVLIAGLEKESLEAGWGLGNVPDAYVNFIVVSTGACTNTSNTSNSPSDTTPPTTPFLEPIGDFGGGFLSLNWSASTDASGINLYDVYREENNSGIFVVIGQTTVTTFDDINVFNANGYAYKIRAIDNAFNQSAFSNTRTIFYSSGGGGGIEIQ